MNVNLVKALIPERPSPRPRQADQPARGAVLWERLGDNLGADLIARALVIADQLADQEGTSFSAAYLHLLSGADAAIEVALMRAREAS